MAELKDFARSVAILVSSCDAFFDAWRPFHYFFLKHWPECPFSVYLIVNQLRVRSNTFQIIAVGEDRGWASNMKVALRQLKEPRVLYLQEDYFLNGAVRPDQLAADLDYAFAHDTDALCLRARSRVDPDFAPLNERFGRVPVASDGRTRCQLTLWKREALFSVLRDGEDAWEMESRGSSRTREMEVLSYRTRDQLPIPYLMSAIVRGLWTRQALSMCQANGVSISPHFRDSYTENSLLRRWRRARSRAAMERALISQRDEVIDLDAPMHPSS